MFATTKRICELLEKNAKVVWITQYMSSLVELVKGVGVHPDRPGLNPLLCVIWEPIFFLIQWHLIPPRWVEFFTFYFSHIKPTLTCLGLKILCCR
jgi:hypothetical protein